MKMANKSKIKMVFFDADGVIFDITGYTEKGKKVAISTWNYLFDKLNIYSEHERLKKLFIKGGFPSYMEWTDEACKVLQKYGLKKQKFMEIINAKSLMKGSKETFSELKRRGYKTALITGSFKASAERVQKIFGLDYITAHCDLIFDKKGNLKKWRLIPCDYEGKIKYFNKLIKKLNLTPALCAYIGDEVNDIPIFKKVGLGIAFNCFKTGVKKAADIVIDKKDLREILPYFPPII